jgi:hypothetical protein
MYKERRQSLQAWPSGIRCNIPCHRRLKAVLTFCDRDGKRDLKKKQMKKEGKPHSFRSSLRYYIRTRTSSSIRT